MLAVVRINTVLNSLHKGDSLVIELAELMMNDISQSSVSHNRYGTVLPIPYLIVHTNFRRTSIKFAFDALLTVIQLSCDPVTFAAELLRWCGRICCAHIKPSSNNANLEKASPIKKLTHQIWHSVKLLIVLRVVIRISRRQGWQKPVTGRSKIMSMACRWAEYVINKAEFCSWL